MTPDRPLLAVQEALKKCFPVVEEQQGRWWSSLRACRPLLASLGNLAEQLQAAQSLRFEDVPSLRAFPDLKERLRRKQLEAGDIVLDKLGERLHVEQVLQIYEQRAETMGIDAVLQASVVSPSVADMLEWLQDIERHYRNSYLRRKYLLSSIQWGDLANIQALPKAWDQLPEDEHHELVQGAGVCLRLHVSSSPSLRLTSLATSERCLHSASVSLINLVFCVLWGGGLLVFLSSYSRYPIECFLLPGRLKKLCVYLETRGMQLKTDLHSGKSIPKTYSAVTRVWSLGFTLSCMGRDSSRGECIAPIWLGSGTRGVHGPLCGCSVARDPPFWYRSQGGCSES
ncbi:hypothetical protein MC885_007961 [Smutsia gigantea]|nr:hypothetical protein MC885_007961 [Smutsia gigantea]